MADTSTRLAGKYRRGESPPDDSRASLGEWDLNHERSLRRFDAMDKLEPIARDLGKTLSQLALAWLLANPVVTAPIIGPRIEEHFDDNLGALGWQAPAEGVAIIDEIVPPQTVI